MSPMSEANKQAAGERLNKTARGLTKGTIQLSPRAMTWMRENGRGDVVNAIRDGITAYRQATKNFVGTYTSDTDAMLVDKLARIRARTAKIEAEMKRRQNGQHSV